MAIVNEGISLNPDKTLNFGNHLLKDKLKINDFEVEGDLFSLRTHKEVTKLEMNGKLLVESVPGASFFNFLLKKNELKCFVSGRGDTKITLELEPETEYKFMVDGENIGKSKSTMSGKINFSFELTEGKKAVKINKI